MLIKNNKVYDILKYLTQVVLPAVGTFYYTVSDTWNLPHGAQVLATDTALITLLGVVLGISSIVYKKGETDGYLHSTGVDPDTGHANLTMVINKLPAELLEKETVRLKVGEPPPNPPAD